MTLEMLVMWMVVGLVAGWLAGIVMKGGGYGLIGDVVLGLVGSIVGSWIFRALGGLAGSGAARVDRRCVHRGGPRDLRRARSGTRTRVRARLVA